LISCSAVGLIVLIFTFCILLVSFGFDLIKFD
jgi:hypothetical protein